MRKLNASFIVAAVLSSLFASVLAADITSGDKEKGAAMLEERLPGSKLSVEEAVKKADLVVVAKVVDMGGAEPDFPGKASYSNAQLKITKSLKGDTAGERRVDVTVLTLPEKEAETVPEKGQEYIVFLTKPDSKQLWAVKMLPSSEEQTRSVKGMLEKKDK